MGIFDRFLGNKAVANPTQALPLPLSQSRDVYLTGYGSGQRKHCCAVRFREVPKTGHE